MFSTCSLCVVFASCNSRILDCNWFIPSSDDLLFKWILNQKLCYASPKLFLQVVPLVTHSWQFQALSFQSSHELCLTGHWSFEQFPQTSFSNFCISFSWFDWVSKWFFKDWFCSIKMLITCSVSLVVIIVATDPESTKMVIGELFILSLNTRFFISNAFFQLSLDVA